MGGLGTRRYGFAFVVGRKSRAVADGEDAVVAGRQQVAVYLDLIDAVDFQTQFFGGQNSAFHIGPKPREGVADLLDDGLYPGRARFRNRFVRTDKFLAEEKAGEFLRPTWTTRAPGGPWA